MRSEALSVWIVEDHAKDREETRAAIAAADDLTCEYAFGSVEDLLARLELTRSDAPAVVLMDIELPGMDGIEGLARLRPVSPATEVIMLTMHEDSTRIFKAFCAGASGYLVKGSPPEKIREAVRDVARGGAAMSTPVARRVVEMFGKLQTPPRDYGLTEREKEVLNELCEGKQKQTIARDLGISIYTVDTHLRNIYAKLQVRSQPRAMAKAFAEGLVGRFRHLAQLNRGARR